MIEKFHTLILQLAITEPKIDISPLPNISAGDRAKALWQNGLTLVFGLAAAIAFLMVVVNGFRYITASGDPQKTAQARQGIVYSAIGLVVSVSAVAIVTFVMKGIS